MDRAEIHFGLFHEVILFHYDTACAYWAVRKGLSDIHLRRAAVHKL
jgi:hypothetical protein